VWKRVIERGGIAIGENTVGDENSGITPSASGDTFNYLPSEVLEFAVLEYL
jgi:hypothetical protein